MFDADGEETAWNEEIISGLFISVVGNHSEPSGDDFIVIADTLSSILSISGGSISNRISCRTVIGNVA